MRKAADMKRKIKIICSQCNFESEDDSAQYCPICGKKIGAEDRISVNEAESANEIFPESKANLERISEPNPIPKATSSARKNVLVPAVIILCAAVGIIAFSLGRGSSDRKSGGDGPASAQSMSNIVSETSLPTAEPTVTVTPTPTAEPTLTATPTSTVKLTTTPEPTEAPQREHLYQFYLEDCTWSEACESAIRKGGHLVTIDTEEEYQRIVRQAESEGYKGNEHFFIGGMRQNNSYSYYWLDENKKLYGEPVNSSSNEIYSNWLNGEPSFTSGEKADMYDETVLMLLRFDKTGEWVLNDIPDDILKVAPYYSGKLGYICEFEC